MSLQNETPPPLRVAIVRCADCGRELNRTNPYPPEAEGQIRVSSAFAAGKCPAGCRSTFSDLNINTKLEFYDVGTEPEVSPAMLQLINPST